jgi:hypothetical protein
MKLRGPLLFLSLLLTACPNDKPIVPLPGPVAQLQRFEDADNQGQFSSIANTAVNSDCQPGGSGSDACPALLAVHGRACLRTARAEAAPGAACPGPTDTAKQMLDCAIRDLGAAAAAGKLDADKLAGVRRNRAQALYCSATFKDATTGGPLAAQAEGELAQTPKSAETLMLTARAALYFAARPAFPKDQRCAAAKRASDAAAAGLQQQDQTATTAEALPKLQNDSAAWAKRIPCTGG